MNQFHRYALKYYGSRYFHLLDDDTFDSENSVQSFKNRLHVFHSFFYYKNPSSLEVYIEQVENNEEIFRQERLNDCVLDDIFTIMNNHIERREEIINVLFQFGDLMYRFRQEHSLKLINMFIKFMMN